MLIDCHPMTHSTQPADGASGWLVTPGG